MPYVVPINIKHYFCNLVKCSVIFLPNVTNSLHVFLLIVELIVVVIEKDEELLGRRSACGNWL